MLCFFAESFGREGQTGAHRAQEAGWGRASGALEHADKNADGAVTELVCDGGDVFAESEALWDFGCLRRVPF